MHVKDFKELISNLPDDTEIEINTIESGDELKPSKISEAHYDENKNKFFITPEIISISNAASDKDFCYELIRKGYSFENSNADGTLKNCYEKYMSLSSIYSAFVSIYLNDDKADIHIYVEYECGGYVNTYDGVIHADIDENPDEFFKELDEFINDSLKYYRK